ncbi:MAG: YIP1 family protein [Anaerolineae bacterium]|nr:YIP1 family protein [Anaerolineae bacterium]MCA9892448.1 YIP1 family protein [Anaerolineae bacterium]MCB9460348.1 YIP1 family protein [Anaerolineaceae bacterium]
MQQNPTPKPPQLPARYSWAEVWTAVLTKPRIETFQEILNDPQATMRRALIWVYLGGLALSSVALYILFSNPEVQQALNQSPEFSGLDVQSALGGMLLTSVPIYSALALLVFMGLIYAMHWIAMKLSQQKAKTRAYNNLAYLIGAIYAPLSIISIIFLLIPLLGYFSIFLTIYQLYLMVLAVRAVYGLDARSGMISVMAPFFALLLLFLFIV